jgi:large subunit ribosomal protein L33
MAHMRDRMIKLVSESGYLYYTTHKSKADRKGKARGKLTLRKYDPIVKKHVIFEERKMPGNS